MKKNGNAHIMHLVLLALFLVMVFSAYQRVRIAVNHKRKKEAKLFTAHVVDKQKVSQIKQAQSLAHKASLLSNLDNEQRVAITEIKNRIDTIAHDYLNPSHALAFLGPIGTAGVVLKEEKLETELTLRLHEISTILHNHLIGNQKKEPNTRPDSLEDSLKLLTRLLN